jgi:tRNA threonylcarbamoyladenosine biosynthesis protein TsaE
MRSSVPSKSVRSIEIATAAAMEAFGASVARAASAPITVYLSGQLAAGKTTFARGYLRGFGHGGAVKSPTFTLVESYELSARAIHHFDLYRLEDAEELEFIGLDEYFETGADCLVEWPERGRSLLPAPDLDIHLTVCGEVRQGEISAGTEYGEKLLESIAINLINT